MLRNVPHDVVNAQPAPRMTSVTNTHTPSETQAPVIPAEGQPTNHIVHGFHKGGLMFDHWHWGAIDQTDMLSVACFNVDSVRTNEFEDKGGFGIRVVTESGNAVWLKVFGMSRKDMIRALLED